MPRSRARASDFEMLVEEARAQRLSRFREAGGLAVAEAHSTARPAPDFRLEALAVSGGSAAVRGRRSLTFPVSLGVHAAGLAALIVVPLLLTENAPPPPTALKAFLVEPSVAPPPAPPPPARAAAAQPRPSANPPEAAFTAPVETPSEIRPEQDVDLGAAGDTAGGVEGGVPGGVVGGIVGGLPAAQEGEPVRVGGLVKEPTKIRHANPVYPELARQARVQGVVVIEAIVGPDGSVRDAKVLRSIPVLDEAALEAVRQWVYTPTLLNGVPTPLIMTVTVTFRLRDV